MENYTKQITPEMVRIVDDLYARKFADATPEEIKVYAEWTRIHALQDAEFEQHARLREQESAQRMETFKEQADAAMNALNMLKEVAIAKLKAVEHGQEEQER